MGRPNFPPRRGADRLAKEEHVYYSGARRVENLKEHLSQGTGYQAENPTRYYSDPTGYFTLDHKGPKLESGKGRRLASAEPDLRETFTASEVVGMTILVVLLYMMVQALKRRMITSPFRSSPPSRPRARSAIPSLANDKKL